MNKYIVFLIVWLTPLACYSESFLIGQWYLAEHPKECKDLDIRIKANRRLCREKMGLFSYWPTTEIEFTNSQFSLSMNGGEPIHYGYKIVNSTNDEAEIELTRNRETGSVFHFLRDGQLCGAKNKSLKNDVPQDVCLNKGIEP